MFRNPASSWSPTADSLTMRTCSAPAPMPENPRRLRTMVRETKAQSGSRVAPEDADTLCRRTTPYTEGWKASAQTGVVPPERAAAAQNRQQIDGIPYGPWNAGAGNLGAK